MAPKTASSTKRSRATAEQIRMMVDLLEEVPGLASGKFQKMHGKLEQQKQWSKLAGKLNAVGGATKSPEQWLTMLAENETKLADNQIKLADNQEKQTEATFAMAKPIERMGKGLEKCAEAFKELSGAILSKDLANN